MMRVFIFLLLISSITAAQVNYDDYFLNKTLRLDYYHTGNHVTEEISFDELIEEPYWGGSKVNLIDIFNYGNYMLKIFDSETNKLIYSRGYSTLFQEWQTTDESKSITRTFYGTVVFPYPKKSVQAEIHRRDKTNNFIKKFSYEVDPSNYFIKQDRRLEFDKFQVHYSGDYSKKLDVLFIPEGYTLEEMNKFKEDCKRFSDHLFYYTPFKENKDKINVWGIEAPSNESGTDIPADGIWKNTLLNSNYYTFDSERYLMTFDYKTVRDVASNAPYDQIYILVNSDKYGGGAIYNYYSLGITVNPKTRQVFIHEFGHGLAGLADEYGGDDTYNEFYSLDVEPWEVNLTTLVDFDKKWKDLIDEDTPIPTPDEENYHDKIGAFEGGGYVSEGIYRPTHNSIMRAFTSDEFNEVCRRVLEKMINFYAE